MIDLYVVLRVTSTLIFVISVLKYGGLRLVDRLLGTNGLFKVILTSGWDIFACFSQPQGSTFGDVFRLRHLRLVMWVQWLE